MALKRFSEDDLVKKGFGMGKDGSFRRMPKLFGEALPVQEKKTKRKYRNNPTEYNGVRYDSEKEANYAKSLDF